MRPRQSHLAATARAAATAIDGTRAIAAAATATAVATAVAVVAVVAGLAPAPASAAGDPILPLSQVRSGMRCTGYSVVRGTDISSFDVEVLDVVDADPNEDGPRILVQVSGSAVDSTGIGPGFSGSPIYCRDGAGVDRNVGAISESIGEYGGKTVLATPIEAILANGPDAPRPRPNAHRDEPVAHGQPAGARAAHGQPAGARAAHARPAGARTAHAPPAGAQRAHTRPVGRGAPAADLWARAARAERRMRHDGTRPLTGPLTVSGLSAPLGRALEAAGRRAGRPVLATPAGPLGSFPKQQLRPGSAVAVGYSSGDLRLGAIGTVAYTDADAVWAFGHPFEAAGARSLFLQDAYVFHVVNDPNTASDFGGSYKLSAPGHDLGTLSNDALDAVVGRVGPMPRSIPIRVRAHDEDTGRGDVLHVNAASETEVGDPTGFSPVGQVAPLVVLQGGTNVLGAAPGRLSGSMCLKITFRERTTPAHFCNRYASSTASSDGSNGVAQAAAFDTIDAFGLVDSYQGRSPHVERVDASLHERRGDRLADLRRVRAPRTVHPGERIRLRVVLQRVRAAKTTRTVGVRLPRHLPSGRRTLTLTGSGDAGISGDFIEFLVGGGGPRGPRTLDQLIRAIDRVGRYDGVRARLAGARFRAFRDSDLLVTGRARTNVRVSK